MSDVQSASSDSDEDTKKIEGLIKKENGETKIGKYSKGRLLGKGGFAKCYEFKNLDNKKIYAAKVIPKNTLLKKRAKEKLISEIKIHKNLKKKEIVSFENYFEDKENVYILLEMCENQTLNELLKRRKTLSELEVQYYIIKLIEALKYLHSLRIIHRDLKLANLFLTDKLELKLGDFGLAIKLSKEGERRKTVCGTPNYIAPEILDGKTGHSYEVDIWSLGVIIYTLIIGKPPFEAPNVKTTYKRVRMNAYSFPNDSIISVAAKDLIQKILVIDPSKRLTLQEIQDHYFFHQGIGIPEFLPTSTLVCSPSLSYIREFIPDVGKDGIVNKPLSNKINYNSSNKITESSLKKNIFKDDNNIGPDIWIKKWADYSSKYGLGYLLSNGNAGVFFNDNTTIILNTKSNEFNYIESKESESQKYISTHSMKDYPNFLKKKVNLLLHFKKLLEGENNNNDNNKNFENDEKEEKIINIFPYIKKWMITRYSTMFRLSNKVIQVCFKDQTEIILSNENKVVTYINEKGERNTYLLNIPIQNNNHEIIKRLKYIKDIFIDFLHLNQLRNAKNENEKKNNLLEEVSDDD